jgi:hypothetical protein
MTSGDIVSPEFAQSRHLQQLPISNSMCITPVDPQAH